MQRTSGDMLLALPRDAVTRVARPEHRLRYRDVTLERSATLLAALVLAGAPRTVQQLAAALGWPPDRVTSALRDAERHPDVTDRSPSGASRPAPTPSPPDATGLTTAQREALGHLG
ncbi:hypothetical protein WME99_30660 [Sorangium sp. So ce136]|uniref:hypothetical protein n=1 Tax=Sorangium sp. So ce136 TaxID=3133284 RepID=UPI003F08A479